MDQRLTDNSLCAYISRLLLNSGDLSAFAILAQETISNKLICFMLHERFKLLPILNPELIGKLSYLEIQVFLTQYNLLSP